MYRLPLAALRSAFPVLGNPFNLNEAVPLTPKQFRYAFGNTLSEQESAAAYERYGLPGPGRVLFQVAFANLNPRAATRINFRNNGRAPVLLVGGDHDHTVPVSLVREAAKRQRKSKAITAHKEFQGRAHYTLGQEGWEKVADYALTWALENATEARSVGRAESGGVAAVSGSSA